MLRNHGFAGFSSASPFEHVDTLLEQNWTQIESTRVSIARVHHEGILHQKVWILPFDEMWHLGLSYVPRTESCNTLGAVETHVTSGSNVAIAASEAAGRVKKGRRVASLIPLGRPFMFKDGSEREIVHMFALPVQGVFPERNHKWFPRVVKPVQYVQELESLLNKSDLAETGTITSPLCASIRAKWVIRGISYALRRFHIKGLVPKSNPMNYARYNDPICCKVDVDKMEDLTDCGLNCEEPGLYNIISYFPEAR